jgi:hypothetical protein
MASFHAIEITYDKDTINNACKNGDIDVLEWIHNSEHSENLVFNLSPINNAIKNGHINVLEWFHKSKYKFTHNPYQLNIDYINGLINESAYVNVLEWLKNSIYTLKYNEEAIQYAKKNKHIKVTEWFADNNINNFNSRPHTPYNKWLLRLTRRHSQI